MKHIAIIIAICWCFLSKAQTELPPNDPLYQVVFVDDFNGAVTDVSKWNSRYGWGQFVPGLTTLPVVDSNGDSVCTYMNPHRFLGGLDFNPFSTHNRKFNGGVMELYGLKEYGGFLGEDLHYSSCPSTLCTANNASCFPGGADSICMWTDTLSYKFSYGMVYSKQLFKYGYFELKFKLPVTSSYIPVYKSISPNFWLFGYDANTYYSELDIHEIDLEHGTKVSNTIHIQETASGPKFAPSIGHNNSATEGQWQTNAGWWTKDSVSFWLNNSMTSNLKNGYCDECFDVDKLCAMSIIIDMHLPAVNFCIPFDTALAPIPYKYEIDYVKVYQPITACDTNKTYLNVTAGTYQHKIYQSLTFGGSGGAVVFNSAKVHAVATDYILLQEGTEIGTVANVTLDIMGCTEDYQYKQKINEYFPLPYSTEEFINKRLMNSQ